MVTRNEQFITQMKLRELREQRTYLLRTYAELQQQTEQAATEEEKLRLLYDGLRQIKFAGQPLHPDVANLQLLLRSAQHDKDALETLTFWRENLENELSQGRLRAEIVYAFGALLEEWTLHYTADATPDPQARQRQNELIDLMTQPSANPLQMEAFLDTLFITNALQLDQEKVRTIFSDDLYAHLDLSELAEILTKISRAIHYSPNTRAQAQNFLADDVLQKEFADALTIMLEHIDEWSWSEAGISTHASLHLTRWRLFLDEDLPTLCLLEILGKRWQEAFSQLFFEVFVQQASGRLFSTSVARGVVTPTGFYRRHQASKSLTLARLAPIDIWADAAAKAASSTRTESEHNTPYYNSIANQRAQLKSQINDIGNLMDYGAQPGQRSGMEMGLTLINAEIELGRAAFPETPLYILKADIKDFYPRLSHELILRMLTRFGLAEKDLTLFRKFLRIPLQTTDQLVWTQRGIPNFHSLSDLLGELLMNLLELYVQNEARVQIVRLVDDICFLATSEAEMLKAWQALQTFCENCGLTLNQAKCGSVCIGGENSAALPSGQPSWLLITLNSEGQWQVNASAFQEYLEQARQEARLKQSLLSQVEVYNTYLRYLLRALFITTPLGDAHRQSIAAAMQQFQQAFVDEEHGMLETLRASIQQRFLGDASLTSLPEAWFYWPITAGGCGLTHSALMPAIFAETYAQRSHMPMPGEITKNWQTHAPEWGSYYASLLTSVSPCTPTPNQIMETLVADFIKRGAEISVGKQKTLAPYWRWILYLYGPQIREQLGTFRFLITELVPLQIILKSYRREDADSADDTGDSDDFDPFLEK